MNNRELVVKGIGNAVTAPDLINSTTAGFYLQILNFSCNNFDNTIDNFFYYMVFLYEK
jgi:hypothetical protein